MIESSFTNKVVVGSNPIAVIMTIRCIYFIDISLVLINLVFNQSGI